MKQLLLSFTLLLSLSCTSQGYTLDIPPDSTRTLWNIRVENAIMNGNYNAAINFLEANIPALKKDTAYAHMLDCLGNLYLLNNEWEKIYQLYNDHYFEPGDDSTLLTMSRFLRDKPRMTLDAGKGTLLKFKSSISGTPIIKVVINGKVFHFWVDSGAGMSVLTASVAKKCGVKQYAGVNATAATGNVIDIGYGLIDSLRTGNLRIKDLPCLVLSDKQLEFRLAGIKIVDIDGIIGWNVLQELSVSIDHKLKMISFDPSLGKPKPGNNLCWMSVPLLFCTDTLNTMNPFLYTFDTGANNSAVYPSFYRRTDTTGAIHKTMTLGSAGGTKKIHTLAFPRLVLMAGGQKLVMHDVSTDPSLQEGFMAPEGVLGNKELNKYILHYDLRGGVFELKYTAY
jgi:hypothetical protein